MAVQVWIGEKPENPNERRALTQLAGAFARLDGLYIILANFSVGGRTLDVGEQLLAKVAAAKGAGKVGRRAGRAAEGGLRRLMRQSRRRQQPQRGGAAGVAGAADNGEDAVAAWRGVREAFRRRRQ